MDRSFLTRCLSVGLLLLMIWPASGLAVAESDDQRPFGGVGLQVVPTVTGELVVLRVVPGSAADRQGLRPGDLVHQVDDFPLEGSEFGQVVAEHLWGPVGSPVTLHYRRPGVAGERHADLVRAVMDPELTVTPAAEVPAGQMKPQE